MQHRSLSLSLSSLCLSEVAPARWRVVQPPSSISKLDIEHTARGTMPRLTPRLTYNPPRRSHYVAAEQPSVRRAPSAKHVRRSLLGAENRQHLLLLPRGVQSILACRRRPTRPDPVNVWNGRGHGPFRECRHRIGVEPHGHPLAAAVRLLVRDTWRNEDGVWRES